MGTGSGNAQAGAPLGGFEITTGDGLAQPVGHPVNHQRQAVIPAEGHQQLADHRQQMGADVEQTRALLGP